MSSRPLNRQQQLQNAAFLRALRRTGNVRLAAQEVGIAYGTMQHRRAKHPAFAVRWDAALVMAQARLGERGQRRPRATAGSGDRHRTAGGEAVVVRRKNGKLQMRRAEPGRLTKQCEQAFLSALSATANVSLSAAAAGAHPAAFYWRRRNHAGFAREWRLALQDGYDRLELALLASTRPESFEDDHWRHNDPPPIPPMTVNQALQLLYLHQKEARLWTTPLPDRLRPGETWQLRSEMRAMIYEAKAERDREAFRVAEALRLVGTPQSNTLREPLVRGDETSIDGAVEGGTLPDLSQVTGWSKASGKPATDDSRALFGGWRLKDIPVERRKRK